MPPKRRRPEDDTTDDSDEHSKLIDEVQAKIQLLGPDTVLDHLETLVMRWKLDAPPETYRETVELYFKNLDGNVSLGLDMTQPGDYGYSELEKSARMQEMEAMALFHRIRELDLLNGDASVKAKLNGVMESVYLAKRSVLLVFQGKLAERKVSGNSVDLEDDFDLQLGSWGLRYRWIDGEITDVQQLILHLLDAAMEHKFKNLDGMCFKPVFVDGNKTHAYEFDCKIEDFVYDSCEKETHFQQWTHLTKSPSTPAHVVKYLSNSNDFQFKKLVKDRHVFSFRNGIYMADKQTFYRFEGSTDPLSDSIVSSKYFDLDFDPYLETEDWYDIPTPHFQSLLDYQEFDDDVCKWVYRMLGRMIYDVGDRDGWQVIPFIHGIAGSGKSTIVSCIQNLYDPSDTGTLSNNVEEKFGLSAFADKNIFIAPEIKKDFKLDQAEFQSMVSGESISVAIKHVTAKTMERWRAAGILAGNQVPEWSDNSGSIARRIVVVSFLKAVTNGDMRLGDKLRSEMAAFICKINRAYLDASAQWGHVDVWTVLPEYFAKTRNEMLRNINPVESFLMSEVVLPKQGTYMPFSDFKVLLRTYEHENGFKLGRYGDDYFRGTFDKFKLVVRRECLEYHGETKTTDYIHGVDLKPNDSVRGTLF